MSIAEELEKLDDLRERGVLSFREFQALKDKLLTLVDGVGHLSELDELKSQDDVSPLEHDAAKISQPDESDASDQISQLDAVVSDEQVKIDTGSNSQSDGSIVSTEVPQVDVDAADYSKLDKIQVPDKTSQFDVDVTRSSRFANIEIPDEVSSQIADPDLDTEMNLESDVELDLDSEFDGDAEVDLSSDAELDLEADNSGQVEKNELLDKVAELDSELENLRRQTAVARLDRAWDREQKRYEIVDENGYRRTPTKEGSVAAGVVVVALGCFWTAMSLGITGGRSAFPFFGLLFIIIGIGVSIYGYRKADDYERARRRYYRSRSKVGRKR